MRLKKSSIQNNLGVTHIHTLVHLMLNNNNKTKLSRSANTQRTMAYNRAVLIIIKVQNYC